MERERRGAWEGLGAYALWGLFPLYWPLLKPAGAVELLAHRTVWSLVVVVGLLAVRREWAWVRELARQPAALVKITLAAATLAGNWGIYIYSVNNGRVVEAALGYFMAPLALMGTGVLVLNERLRTFQWAAMGLGAGAVVILIAAYGRVPWAAFALAASRAVYGYLKKTVELSAMRSLAVETGIMCVPAIAFLGFLAWRGDGTFGTEGTGHSLLLVTTGLSVVPLLLFATAAQKVPLSTLGMLQYVEPAMQFAIGVAILHEPMPSARWFAFVLVWAALVLLSYDVRRTARLTAERQAV